MDATDTDWKARRISSLAPATIKAVLWNGLTFRSCRLESITAHSNWKSGNVILGRISSIDSLFPSISITPNRPFTDRTSRFAQRIWLLVIQNTAWRFHWIRYCLPLDLFFFPTFHTIQKQNFSFILWLSKWARCDASAPAEMFAHRTTNNSAQLSSSSWME